MWSFVGAVMEIAGHSEFFIRIIPTATSVFDVSRLNLTRNNVRAFSQGNPCFFIQSWNFEIAFLRLFLVICVSDKNFMWALLLVIFYFSLTIAFWTFLEGGVTQATPKYNSSIMEDMFLEENAEFIGKAFFEWKSLEEALILLKVSMIIS